MCLWKHCQMSWGVCRLAVMNSTVSNIAITLQCLEPSKVYRLVQVGGTAVNLFLSCLLFLSLSRL